MPRTSHISGMRSYFVIAAILLLPFGGAAHAQTYQILHAFAGGDDGEIPLSGLILDDAGNLYGTTELGGGFGTMKHGVCTGACGTAFKLAPNGSETILHAFANKRGDGGYPEGGLLVDSTGNLFGTTAFSSGSRKACPRLGCGTVFEIATNGAEHVIYKFAAPSDGDAPGSILIADQSGNHYGTTTVGGSNCNCGTVYKVAKSGSETVLHTFGGGSDGSFPRGGLVADGAGNLYGTTSSGGGTGCGGQGCGTIYKLAPDGTETVLYEFGENSGAKDGTGPTGELIFDGSGNLYGMTAEGGSGTCSNDGPGCGTIFKLASDSAETVLYSFKGGNDGAYPAAGLAIDAAGNFYGTTSQGGGQTGCGNGADGCGTVFELATSGSETVLHAFAGGGDGSYPLGRLVSDSAGNLYGTTQYGGGGIPCGNNGCGTVFKIQE